MHMRPSHMQAASDAFSLATYSLSATAFELVEHEAASRTFNLTLPISSVAPVISVVMPRQEGA